MNSQRPTNYIELRTKLESRMRELFILKGGKPERNDPFYFTLGKCDWLKSWYVNPGVVKIPLSDIDPDKISFTYPDSMVSFQLHDNPKLKTYRKESNGKLFLTDELKALIEANGLPSEEKSMAKERFKHDKYIEAQIWSSTVINNYR